MNYNRYGYITVCFLGLILAGCGSGNTGSNSPVQETVSQPKTVSHNFSFVSPSENQFCVPGNRLNVSLKNSGAEQADSVVFYIDGIKAGEIKGPGSAAQLSTNGINPGTRRLRMNVFLPGGKTENNFINLKFLSDIPPVEYTYKVIGTFPHDYNAYTQGFEYHDGYFFEGTGQYGQSSLRKIIPGTGDIIKLRNLASDLFGEGITLLKGRIYQITYRSRVGFIYDASSFEQIQKFYYQNLEGWGLTNDGNQIIMSDGTNIIYFLDPEYFSANRKIEVCDNVSELDSLNELELINGVIYSNRYLTNEIVMIDPATGKVTGRADMKGLLKKEDIRDNTDVLNGIAWDGESHRLFVTGKNWPKIFQVELIKK
jgi:glutaminyl-peptide cyclotransferase